MSSWAFFAPDASYWKHLLSSLGPKTTEWRGDVPNPDDVPPPPSPPPSPPHTRHQTHPPPSPTTPPPRTPQTPPPPSPPTTHPPETENDYDLNGVGKNVHDSLAILGLYTTSTEREIKVRYRSLARIFHPDKYDSTTTTMSKEQAQEHFKHINNADEFLRTR